VGIADANSLFPLVESEETPAKNTERRLSTSGLTLQVAVEAIDAMGKQDADIAMIPTTLDQSQDFSLSLRVNFDAMRRSARLPSLHCWLLVWISRRITPADQVLCFYSLLKRETGLPATNTFTHTHSRTASVPIIPHDAITVFAFSQLCGIRVGDRPLEDKVSQIWLQIREENKKGFESCLLSKYGQFQNFLIK
jgi:hypothetical protein